MTATATAPRDAASPALTCYLCGGPSATQLFVSKNGYPIVRCDACHLVFTDARTAPPAAELYPAFDQTKDAAAVAARDAASMFLRARSAIVRRSIAGTRGRVLDYGCGNGSFARHMAALGFESVGLEPFSLGSAQHDGALTLLKGPLAAHRETIARGGNGIGTFDAITLWHVLEHVPDPVETLRALRGCLREGGVLVVSVPNFGSIQSKVFKGAWFHLDPPRHLLHFEADTLKDCLARAGFDVVSEHPFLPEYGSSGWIQSALNGFLPHQNFLYELVKDRGALAKMGPLSKGTHLAASLALGAPLFAASIPVEALAGASAAALTFVCKAR